MNLEILAIVGLSIIWCGDVQLQMEWKQSGNGCQYYWLHTDQRSFKNGVALQQKKMFLDDFRDLTFYLWFYLFCTVKDSKIRFFSLTYHIELQ